MQPSILLIEDSPDILTMMQTALRTKGYNVLTAMTGSDAIDILHQTQPDLILLDVQLSDMTGHQLLDHLERHLPHILKTPIVFSTAGDPPKDHRVRGQILKVGGLGELIRGVAHYLTHPFQREPLIQA